MKKIGDLNDPMDLHEHGRSHPQNLLDSFEHLSNARREDADYIRDMHRVRKLEGLVGERLTERKKGLYAFPIRLTEAGRALLEKIRQWRETNE